MPKSRRICATKWAIEGLTQALAQELPPGMAAVPLNPGIVNTDMLRSCFGGSTSSYPTPREWAGIAVPFLFETRRSGQWPAADRAYLRREWLDFLRARGLLVPGVDAGEG